MFKRNIFYKHEKNTDVCLEVQGVLRRDDEGVSLIVSWWNIKAKKPRKLVRHQVVWIEKSQVPNWKEVSLEE